MCPDPQILSIYLDGELPSPWKEKMESHFLQCPACREKLENLKHLHELLNAGTGKTRVEEARNRVWQKLESGRRFRTGARLWRRRLSVPLPAAAAAAVIIALLATLWIRDERIKNRGFAQYPQELVNFAIAAEEEIPGVIPAADINGVLQYLTSDGADVIILRLPESRNFFRTGDPAIIRAADYSRRQP
jgi:anti-sigma factor RsiW